MGTLLLENALALLDRPPPFQQFKRRPQVLVPTDKWVTYLVQQSLNLSSHCVITLEQNDAPRDLFEKSELFEELSQIEAMKKAAPFEFVFDELEGLPVTTKPMFGCLGMYVGNKIVFIQRMKQRPPVDDGLWVATTGEHHESLHAEFPNMRSIEMFGPGPTGWPQRMRTILKSRSRGHASW